MCAPPRARTLAVMDESAVVTVRGLRKTYGSRTVVAGLDLQVHAGGRIRDGEAGPRTLFGHVSGSVTDSRVLSALHHWYATEADEDQ